MLEAYKSVDGLARAWRSVAEAVPDGAPRDRRPRERSTTSWSGFVDDYPGRVEHVEQVPPQGVAEQMDERNVPGAAVASEGLGRVIIESFARGRGACRDAGSAASRTWSSDDEDGMLVEPAATTRIWPMR